MPIYKKERQDLPDLIQISTGIVSLPKLKILHHQQR
jgi:hypothetical protein